MGNFRRLLYTRKVPITLEAPIIRDKESFNNFIRLFREYELDRFVIGINILNNPLGNLSSDPLILGSMIQNELHIDSIPHISASLENEFTLARWVLGASLLDINNFLVLSGDVRFRDTLSLEEALKLIKMFREGVVEVGGRRYSVPKKEFFLGAALIPERDNELDRLLRKVGWGVEFFQTQITFDIAKLAVLLNELSKRQLKKKLSILVSIVPYLNDRIIRLLGGGNFKLEMFGADKLSEEDYSGWIKNLIGEIIELRKNYNTVNLGIHLIPILWSKDISYKISKLLENSL